MNLQHIFCGGLLCLNIWRFSAIWLRPAELGFRLYQPQYISSEWSSIVKNCWICLSYAFTKLISTSRASIWRFIDSKTDASFWKLTYVMGQSSWSWRLLWKLGGSYYISAWQRIVVPLQWILLLRQRSSTIERRQVVNPVGQFHL